MRALAVLGELFGRQFEIEDRAEKLARLLVCKQKLAAVDDGEAGLRLHARERERRHVARDDDDVDNVGQVGEQAVNDAVDWRLRAEVVVVVEDEDELLLDAVEHFVEEHVDGALRLLGQLLGGLVHVRDGRVAEAGDDLLDAVRDVAEEDERVGVGLVKLVPDEGARARAHEVGDERGLSRPRGRGDERDGVREVLLQPLDEARARQKRRRGARRQKLRAQEEGGQLRHEAGGRLRVVDAPFLSAGHVRHHFGSGASAGRTGHSDDCGATVS